MENIRRFTEIIFHLSLASVRIHCIRNPSPNFSGLKQPNFAIGWADLLVLAAFVGDWWHRMALLTYLEPLLTHLELVTSDVPLHMVSIISQEVSPGLSQWWMASSRKEGHSYCTLTFPGSVSHCLMSHWPKQMAKRRFNDEKNRFHFLLGGVWFTYYSTIAVF